MNSTKAKAIADYESGNISGKEFGRILARITMRRNRKSENKKSRNERRYK